MKRKTKKKVAYVGLVMFGIIMVAFLLAAINTPERKNKHTDDTYYHSYKIEAGDTIDDISHFVDRYNDNLNFQEVKEYICELNGIYPDEIISGHHIILPYTNAEMLEELGE